MSAPFRLTGWHVLAALLGFFGITFVVNGIFVVMALRSAPGEDATKAYTRGVDYNRVLAARAAQAEAGWIAELTTERGDGARASIEIALRDRGDAPVVGLNLRGSAKHPADASRDASLTFREVQRGVYVVRTDLPPGRWRLEVEALESDPPFALSSDVWLP